jgi:putative two-component system response regulator
MRSLNRHWGVYGCCSSKTPLQTSDITVADLKGRIRELEAREKAREGELVETKNRLKTFAQSLELTLELERRRAQELEQAYYDTILRLTRASAYKDRETGAHIQRLSHYSRILARHLGWSEPQQELIFRAAPMHDVGKIAIPDAVIRKRGKLETAEWQLMLNHPVIGASLLEGSNSDLLEMAREIALTHHERWDGSGYPNQLSGDEIPLSGRIVGLGDTYDALRSRRSYKVSFDHERACTIILKGDRRTKPQHFDPLLLEAFRAVNEEFRTVFDSIAEEPA